MTELTHRTKWMTGMLKKLSLDMGREATEEDVKAFMRESGAKAQNTGKGGFYHMKLHAPDKLKQISIKGGKTSGKSKIN